jgi:hypothetical protein
MPRVVPSQVVSLINQSFPGTQTAPDFPIYSASAGVLSAIVHLTNDIPPELLTVGAEDYTDLVCALEGLTSAVNRWLQRGGDDPPARIKSKSPVSVIVMVHPFALLPVLRMPRESFLASVQWGAALVLCRALPFLGARIVDVGPKG